MKIFQPFDFIQALRKPFFCVNTFIVAGKSDKTEQQKQQVGELVKA